MPLTEPGLGLLGPINAQTMTPEMIAILESIGMHQIGAGPRGREDKFTQPVGPEAFQAIHWTQGAADVLNAIAGSRAIQTAERSRLGMRMGDLTPPQRRLPPSRTTVTPTPDITNPNSALRRGAVQETSDRPMVHLARGEGEDLGPQVKIGKTRRIPPDRQLIPDTMEDTLDHQLRNTLLNATREVNAPDSLNEAANALRIPGRILSTRDINIPGDLTIHGDRLRTDEQNIETSNVLPDSGGMRGFIPPEMRVGAINELQPPDIQSPPTGHTGGDQLHTETGTTLAQGTPELQYGRGEDRDLVDRFARSLREPPPIVEQPPNAQAPLPTTDRTVHGLPVYRRGHFDALADIPPPMPHMFGLSPEQQMMLSNYREQDRQLVVQSLTYQWTPQYTEVPGGRQWIIPHTGERGYIPVPVDSRVRTATGTEVTSRTLFDRNGRRHTYILEPGDPPPNVVTADRQPPNTQQPPPSTDLQPPNTQQPPATIQPPPGIQLQQPPSGETFQDRGMFLRDRQIDVEQAGLKKGAVTGSDIAWQSVTQAVVRGDAARHTLAIISTLQDALNQPGADRIMSGQYAQQWMEFQRTVNGVFQAAGMGTPFDQSQVTVAEAIEKLNTFLGGAAARELTNRPTQFDFQTFLRVNAGLQTSPEGRRLIAQIQRQFAERDIEISNMASQFAERRSRTGSPEGFNAQMQAIHDRRMQTLVQTIVAGGGQLPVGTVYNGYRYRGGPIRESGSWVEVPELRRATPR